MKKSFHLLALTLISATLAFGRDNFGVEEIGRLYHRWIGVSHAVAQDGRLYLACGYSGLQIIDASDPGTMHQIGVFDEMPANWVSTKGDFVYLLSMTTQYYALIVLDLNDPVNPTLVNQITLPGRGVWIEIDGNSAFIQCAADVGAATILTYDITEPAAPREVGRKVPISFEIFSAEGNVAVAAAGERNMYSLDITNPARPRIDQNFYFYSSSDLENLFFIDNCLYVQDGNQTWSFDASNPDQITVTDSLELNTTGKLAVVGGYGYSTHYRDSLLLSVDLRNPNEFGDVDTVIIPAMNSDFQIGDEGSLYLLREGSTSNNSYSTKIEAYSLDNPARPAYAGDLSQGGNILSVVNSGNIAYIVDAENGIRIVDFSDPEAPSEIDTIVFSASTEAIFKIEEKLFVRDANARIYIYNIADPTAPDYLGRFTWHADLKPITFRDDTLVCYTYSEGLMVIDESDMRHPRLLDFPPVQPGANDAIVRGNRLYLLHESDGLNIYDISDLARVVQLNDTTPLLSRNTRNLEIAGNLAIAVAGSYIYFIDITDETSPTLIGQLRYDLRYSGVKVSGNLLYLSCAEYGFSVYDISDPATPILIAHIESNSYVNQVIPLENGTLVAAESKRLGIYRIEEPEDSPRWTVFPDTLISVVELDTLVLRISATDQENRQITLRLNERNLPEGLTLSDFGDGNGEVRWIPQSGDMGRYRVAVQANNGVATLTSTLSLIVQPDRAAPVWTRFPADTLYAMPYDSIDVTMRAEDADRDVYFRNNYGQPYNAELTSNFDNSCRFVWVPTNGQEGIYHFEIYATGAYGSTIGILWVVVGRLNAETDAPANLPEVFGINGVYPNPFNSTASVRVGVPVDGTLKIVIYDVNGRQIRSDFLGRQSAGYRNWIWDGKSTDRSFMASGIYFCEVTLNDGKGVAMQSRTKVVLLR